MTELVERYRRNAEKCLELVQSFHDPEAKRALLVMANAWLVLAAQREKKIEIAPGGEITSQINKPPPSHDPPVIQPSPQRLNTTKPDDPAQC